MGSAYLTEALIGRGDFSSDIDSKIIEISQKITSLKSNIRSIIDEDSINFSPFLKENVKLKNQAHSLLEEMKDLYNTINSKLKPELKNCFQELKTLSKELQEVNLSLYFLNQLFNIHTLIKSIRMEMQNKKFFECAKLLRNVQELIKQNSSELEELDMFKALSKEADIAYDNLLENNNKLWNQHVVFETKDGSDGKLVKFSIDTSAITELSEILKSLEYLQYALLRNKFVNMFLNVIVNDIIKHRTKVSYKGKENSVLVIEILKDKPEYNDVFQNLIKAIEFLQKHLNIDVNDEISHVQKIYADIGTELSERVIKYCLSETVPATSEDLDKYSSIVENTESFENKLKEYGFLQSDFTCLTDYTKNINVLFAMKFCQSYLEKARIIMKKDLHNVTNTEEVISSNIKVLPKMHQGILKSKLNIQEDDGFTFPICQISKSANELTELVRLMIQEMKKSPDLCVVRLFFTIRDIFEMYSAIVPLHHRKFLDTLPHQVAIFHNNCLYFTHFLINFTCEHYKNIPAVQNDDYNELLEEAVLLRTLAAEILELHVTYQKNQLVYILRDSGLATLNEDPNLDPTTEKSIRQCIRQLHILQSKWKDVLPFKVYNRAIGYLLDSVIEELISLIMAVEDISSQTATDLASIFTIVIEKTSSLIQEPIEIFTHVKKWHKLKEFIRVLNGTLREIDDRWLDGSGPLAKEFTAPQVKHLIRALFQNSDKRSALLNRIQ